MPADERENIALTDAETRALHRDRVYAAYRSGQGNAESDDRAIRAPYLRRVIARHFPADRQARILDLGCGSGTLLHHLREAGYQSLRGVDVSPEQVEAAHRMGIEGVELGDLLEILTSIPAQTQDVVICFDIIEHLTKHELLALADQIQRVLTPGGRWLIHAPNAGALFGARSRYADWTHEQAFTPDSLSQIAHVTRFTSCACHSDTPVVHGLPSAFRAVVWKGVTWLLTLALVAEKGGAGSGAIFTQNLLAVLTK